MASPAGDYTSTLPRKRMGSAVLVRDLQSRILLCGARIQRRVREVEEELGLSITPGRLLVMDWVAPRTDRTEGVMFVYEGSVLDPRHAVEIQSPVGELRGWGRGRPAGAFQALLEAERDAPQEVRYRPWAQNLTRDLMSAGGRGGLSGVREFAGRIGVTA